MTMQESSLTLPENTSTFSNLIQNSQVEQSLKFTSTSGYIMLSIALVYFLFKIIQKTNIKDRLEMFLGKEYAEKVITAFEFVKLTCFGYFIKVVTIFTEMEFEGRFGVFLGNCFNSPLGSLLISALSLFLTTGLVVSLCFSFLVFCDLLYRISIGEFLYLQFSDVFNSSISNVYAFLMFVLSPLFTFGEVMTAILIDIEN